MPSQASPAQPCLDEPAVPADPKRSELIPGEDLGGVCAGHGLAHLAGGDPGPGVLVSPQDDLNHPRGVLGPRGQGHAGVVVGSHGQVETSEALWPLHVLELVLVGRGDMNSLWMEERKRGHCGLPEGPCLPVSAPGAENWDNGEWVSLWLGQQLQRHGCCWLNNGCANSTGKKKCSQGYFLQKMHKTLPWELAMLLKLRKTQVSGEPDTFMGLKTIFQDANLQM